MSVLPLTPQYWELRELTVMCTFVQLSPTYATLLNSLPKYLWALLPTFNIRYLLLSLYT